PRAGPHTSGELMFDHVKFGVSDYAASKAFFLKALEPLGVAVVSEGPPTYGVELSPKGKASLCLYQTEEKPAHLHLAFTAENRQQVEAFYRAALEAGGEDNGAPGLLPHYHARYYAAFVIVRTGTTSKWFATNPRPNPSIEGTSTSGLRPLATTPSLPRGCPLTRKKSSSLQSSCSSSLIS